MICASRFRVETGRAKQHEPELRENLAAELLEAALTAELTTRTAGPEGLPARASCGHRKQRSMECALIGVCEAVNGNCTSPRRLSFI